MTGPSPRWEANARDQFTATMTVEALIESAVERAVQRVLGPYLHRIGEPDPVVCTVAQVAAMLQVSDDTIGRMVKQGTLPKLPELGSRILIPRWAVDELVDCAVKADSEDGGASQSAGHQPPATRRPPRLGRAADPSVRPPGCPSRVRSAGKSGECFPPCNPGARRPPKSGCRP